MITEKAPDTWKDLQNDTAEILLECGLKVDVETRLDTVRGKVEFDVVAYENIDGREYKIVIECKNWNSRVPQNVAHAFRTTVSDLGAHAAYIVSKAGFQSGAYEAVKNTNVKLLDWHEFQNEFEEKWINVALQKRIQENLWDLLWYLEPIPKMVHFDKFSTPEETVELIDMHKRNQPLYALITIFPSHQFAKSIGISTPKLPLKIPEDFEHIDLVNAEIPEELFLATGYKEYFDIIESHAQPILKRFKELELSARAREKQEQESS